ncbi:hypothetical protein E2C01_067915 [Portunus trituberculatus]|uniref:Uncharacterized protein n=1 Tax=Portunus trituberculatus TaxID=210409 RepID=A0A5B7HL43_PORTR|nr:hypothetical protein [Portunus trituberculatus]
MPLVHSRRWSVDRSSSTYGYSGSWRRSSIAEASLWRRDAGNYLRLASDGGRSWTRLESFRSSGDSFRSYGDSFGRRDRGYEESLYRRNRSYDISDRDSDRQYGSKWRDTVYSKPSTRDSSGGFKEYEMDSSYTTDASTSRALNYRLDSDSSQPKRDSDEWYDDGHCKKVRFINIQRQEVSQPGANTPLDTGTGTHTQEAQKEEAHSEYGVSFLDLSYS